MLISPGNFLAVMGETKANPFTSKAASQPTPTPNSTPTSNEKHARDWQKKEFIISVLIAFFILSKFQRQAGFPILYPSAPYFCDFACSATSFTTNNCLQEIQLWLLITDSSGQKERLARNDGKLHVTLNGCKRIREMIFAQGRCRYDRWVVCFWGCLQSHLLCWFQELLSVVMQRSLLSFPQTITKPFIDNYIQYTMNNESDELKALGAISYDFSCFRLTSNQYKIYLFSI